MRDDELGSYRRRVVLGGFDFPNTGEELLQSRVLRFSCRGSGGDGGGGGGGGGGLGFLPTFDDVAYE